VGESLAWLPLLAGSGGTLTLAELAADIAGSPEFQNRCAAFV
jgi:hypothetical protein